MNKEMLNIIEGEMPKINPDIANGVAMKFIGEAESYIDRDLRVSSDQLPEGLKYLGYEVCTPTEEYFEIMRRREKLTVELSRSDMYLVRYRFEYMGEEIQSRYIYLPFVEDAGIMHIRGTPYVISPVIADVAISVTPDGLFCPLGLAKAQFERFTHHFKANGSSTSANVVHSYLYRRSKTSKATKLGKNTLRSTMLHYILCKYGFSETMRMFFGCEDILVSTREEIHDVIRTKEGLDVTGRHMADGPVEQAAFDKWVQCSTIYDVGGTRPSSSKDKFYKPSNVVIAVKRTYFEGDKASALIDALGSIFYVIDVLPNRIMPAYFDSPQLWQSIMGIVIFGNTEATGEGERQNLMAIHMDSLDGYVNYQSKRNLSQAGVNVDTIYEFFSYVVHSLPELVLNANTTVASLYNKRLMITRYVLSEISYAIYGLMFKLRARASKKGRLSTKEVLDGMRKGLHRDTIASITSRHAEVTPVSSPGDNKIFKLTSNMVLQENTDTSKSRGGGGSLNDPAKFLHVSLIDIASYAAMAKNEPTGRGKMNIMMKMSARGDVEQHEEHVPLLEYTQQLITDR